MAGCASEIGARELGSNCDSLSAPDIGPLTSAGVTLGLTLMSDAITAFLRGSIVA